MTDQPSLMLVFERNKDEAAAVFRLIAGYGELEYKLAECLGNALGDPDGALLAIFIDSGVQARINMTAALAKKFYKSIGLSAKFNQAIAATDWCLSTRNLFAHCHWADWSKDPGLYFVSLYRGAERDADAMAYEWLHTDAKLLREAELYFIYARECLFYLTEAAIHHREDKKGPLTHAQWPAKRDAPRQYNDPEQHIPPWPSLTRKRPHSRPAEKPKSAGQIDWKTDQRHRRLRMELREYRLRQSGG